MFSIMPMHLNRPRKSDSFSARRHHSLSNLTPGLALFKSFSCAAVSSERAKTIGIEYVSPASVLPPNMLGSSPGSQLLITSSGGTCEMVFISVSPGIVGRRNLSVTFFSGASA